MFKIKPPRFLLSLLFLISTAVFAPAEDEDLVWGTTAIQLQPPVTASPTLDDLLQDDAKVVSLNHFYLVGGENRAATPTECRIGYDSDNLYVVFRCQENDLSFPAMSHHADWYSLLNLPSEQDSEFPDTVNLFIQPDMNRPDYYQFAATLDGQSFGCRHESRSNPDEQVRTNGEDDSLAATRTSRVNAFTATVTKRTNEWVVFLTIPWKTLGGKPDDHFGLLPMRSRWRDGEVSSPVAMGFNERPQLDLLIETHFPGQIPVQSSGNSLIQLPSGALRWQRPAILSYPAPEVLQQIWQMQQSLNEPADASNFAQRLYLTQRWVDFLTLEGFNFRPGSGAIVQQDMTPDVLRSRVNGLLRTNGIIPAGRLLEVYLKKLDKVSRQWFADGSPGDILQDEWKSVTQLESASTRGNVMFMHCLAEDHEVDLQLSLPQSGGVRIHGAEEGYFKPAGLLPLKVARSTNSYSIETANGTIVIQEKPFEILFNNTNGNQVPCVGQNGLAFRFNQEGKIIAADFRGHLDPDETIYGFGERYDHFNENGNVLTLWGMDDWTGNTVGLMNQTYKPIPIFHSSKDYMVFDNSSYRLRADIGKTKQDEYRLTQQGPIFDYYFWMASPESALRSYTELTGKPILPPKWAFEPWMGRTGRGWNKPSHNPVAEEENVFEQFEKLDIPHSAIYSEGAGADSAALNTFMAGHGIKVMSWFYPVISQAGQAKLMPEKKPEELPVLHTEDPWQHVDFSNPNARELFRRVWNRRLSLGVAGSMVDFGDRVTEDAVFYDGRRGDEMHNFYAYDYHRTCSETFREKRGDDFILIGRAAAPGTQKWVAQFAGDHPSNFKGLRSVLTGALNLCSCGFSTWGSDLGGFLGWPEPAVYMRWTQFGCFSPLMRCHGRTPREPWNYGDAAVANYKYYAWVRENLLDYIYSCAMDSHKTGVSMMRSMAVAYPAEPAMTAINDQYMFGRDLLVAPVVDEDNSRTISFPAGKWSSLWTGITLSGPTNILYDVPLDTIPAYLSEGAIMPVQLDRDLQFGKSMTSGRVSALIVTPPVDKQEAVWLNNQGGSASAILQPEDRSFAITLTNPSETNYLLIYDAAATAIKADGKLLPKLAGDSFDSMPAGWQADPALNRLVVRLPSSHTGPLEIEVEIQPEMMK